MSTKNPELTDPIIEREYTFEQSRAMLKAQLKTLAKNGSQRDKMETTTQLAMAEIGLGNMKESTRLVKSVEKYIMNYGSQKAKGYVLFMTALNLSAQAQYEKGLPVILRALHIFSTLGIPVFEMRALLLCSRYCLRLNMIDEAIDYINKAIEISRSLEDKAQIVLCMYSLNDIRSHVVSSSENIKDAEQLVKYVNENLGDSPSTLKVNTNEGAAIANINAGRLDRAKMYAKIASDIRAQLKETNATLMPDSYNMHANICAADNDEKGMLRYTDMCIALCQEQKIILGEMQANEIRFRYYLNHGRMAEAKKYLDRTAKCVPDEDNYLSKTILCKCFIEYYNKAGDTANELKYTNKSNEYQTAAQQKVIMHRIKHLNAVHELEIKEKENEIMKKELNIKTQELNLSNHYLQQRNELLNDLKESINSLKKENSQREVIFQTLFKKIDVAFNKEESEKNLFKEKFDKAHTEFIRNLSKAYPNLSVTECRICALLHSGFNTKEIATLLSTSERNIETHRLHVRKKMNLTRNDNLNLVLASIKF